MIDDYIFYAGTAIADLNYSVAGPFKKYNSRRR
jgi:hypothetical protein